MLSRVEIPQPSQGEPNAARPHLRPAAPRMKCPNCGAERVVGAPDCAACGIVFEKWAKRQAEKELAPLARQESAATDAWPSSGSAAPNGDGGDDDRHNLSTCFVAAAVYAAGEVFCVYLTVKMRISVPVIILLSIAVYPLVIAYFARSAWKLTTKDLMWVIVIISIPTLVYGMIVRPELIRFTLDSACLAVSAGCAFAGFKYAKRSEIGPT